MGIRKDLDRHLRANRLPATISSIAKAQWRPLGPDSRIGLVGRGSAALSGPAFPGSSMCAVSQWQLRLETTLYLGNWAWEQHQQREEEERCCRPG